MFDYRQLLSAEERAHVDQLRLEHLKNAYTIAHGALRLFLAEVLGCSTGHLRFEIGPGGKPYLKQPRGCFNMSHSGQLAVYAITTDCEVGLDVERIREVTESEHISKAFFCEEESAEILSLPRAAEKNEAFLRCWTRKEAYLKALGDGLRSPLNRIRVSVSREWPRFIHIGHSFDQAKLWTLHHIDPVPGYLGALAYRGPKGEVVMHAPIDPAFLLGNYKRVRQKLNRLEWAAYAHL